MYYNNKFKFLIRTLPIITILIGIISIAKPNFKMGMLIMFIPMSLQQLLMGVNYSKLNKKAESILSIGAGIFMFLCLIISIIFIVS